MKWQSYFKLIIETVVTELPWKFFDVINIAPSLNFTKLTWRYKKRFQLLQAKSLLTLFSVTFTFISGLRSWRVRPTLTHQNWAIQNSTFIETTTTLAIVLVTCHSSKWGRRRKKSGDNVGRTWVFWGFLPNTGSYRILGRANLDWGYSFIPISLVATVDANQLRQWFKFISTQPETFKHMRHPVLLFVLSRWEENGPRAVAKLFWTRN